MAAGTEGQAAEQLHGLLARPFVLLLVLLQYLIALCPEAFRDDWLKFERSPFTFRLVNPSPVADLPRAVEMVYAFGTRTPQNPADSDVAPLCARTGAVSGFVQELGDMTLAAVRGEEFVSFPADRSFGGIDDELLVLPLVSVRRRPVYLPPQLGAGGNGRVYAVGDLFALPLRHGRDHGVKEAAGRSRGVDLLLERDHVGLVLSENIREFQEFLCIASQARELGEDEAGNVAAANVGEHPAGFWMIHDGFAGHAGKVIYFSYVPAVELRILAGAGFVEFGAFSMRLILGRNPNPDADVFGRRDVVLHNADSYPKMERGRKENSVAKPRIFCYETRMPEKTLLSERDLARLAKRFRKQAGKSRAQAARDMHVAQVSIFRAEEDPKESLLKLRRRMIEAYSPFKVVGAVFYLERK